MPALAVRCASPISRFDACPRGLTAIARGPISWVIRVRQVIVRETVQDDTYTESYISTIGVDFVRFPAFTGSACCCTSCQ